MTRVLVVEDEDSFSDAISYLLRKEGFEVAVCSTGPDALDTFDRTGADLVLLDLMLPGLPGSEVCRSLREKSSVPVIMLTAKDSEIDKVVGLELGADDYVTKPFSSRELVARMRAVLRRRGDPEDVADTALESGPVRMDVDRHVVTVRGGTVSLPLKEFELLQVLLRNADRVLTRMQLIDRVLGRRLRGRHQDAGRAHQAAAGQDRGRPGQAAVHRHGARPGLQVRVSRLTGGHASPFGIIFPNGPGLPGPARYGVADGLADAPADAEPDADALAVAEPDADALTVAEPPAGGCAVVADGVGRAGGE